MLQSQDGNTPITQEELLNFLKSPEESALSLSQLEALTAKYPAFTAGRLAYLKKLQQMHHISFVSNIRNAIVLLSDKRQIFQFLADSHLGWNEVFEMVKQRDNAKQSEPLSTHDALSLIESFLNKGTQNATPDQSTPAATRITPVSDSIEELQLEKEVQSSYAALNYVNQLLAEEDQKCEENENPLEHQDLIDKFISFSDEENNFRSALSQVKQETEFLDEYPYDTDEEIPANKVSEPSEDDLLTESLAKIYIKQKRYEKALEIIKSLSLKYPKKSVYFADQIRYLELLIANIKK